MTEFLAMGGYAFFVWMSFGLTFVVMLAIALGSLHQRRRAIQLVKRSSVVASQRSASSDLNEQNPG